MTDWFYHDPGRGRVGPLSADDLLGHYRDRRLLRDRLVWHEGLREWQPLDRLSEQLGLDQVVPDAGQPPPLPAAAPPRVARPAAPAAAPPRRGLSGCLIAIIALAALAVPVLGILTAIAVPAYQDYTVRAEVARALAQTRGLQAAVDTWRRRHDSCPDNATPAFSRGQLDSFSGPGVAAIRLGTLENGHCAIGIELHNLGDPELDGRTVLLESTASHDWTCTGGSLAEKYRPARCRAPTPRSLP